MSLPATLLMIASTPIAIIPQPAKVSLGEGQFRLDSGTRIVVSAQTEPVGRLLQDYLRPATGFSFDLIRKASGHFIELKVDDKLGSQGPESYRLTVKNDKVTITGASPAGVFYGVQSLRQLFPSPLFRRAKVDGIDWVAPAVDIEDSPRFSWRGAHLDVGRHFMPKEFILKYLDLMALEKLNSFHWHLTEDQGWRIEIKRYPRLTSVGAFRKDSMLNYSPAKYSGEPHGGFYTQDDVREIVAYAKQRYITVVPEIEMPGHAQAAIAAYPELGVTGEQLEVATKWGVIENVLNADDSTIEFMKNILTEVMDLFPGQFIHIGGDECPKVQWKASPKIQARMKQLGVADEHGLQSWFIRQMDEFLTSKKRRLIGWSEILEGGLAPNAALMVWLGDEGAQEAVASGHDVVMAQTSSTYFDYYQVKDTTNEPHQIGGFLPIEQVYAYEPILPSFTPEQAKHVLGTQFQLWTEYIPDGKRVEYMAFPRACALAEVAWSSKANRNFADFSVRLKSHLERLRSFDVNYHP